jgi:hypothetical protein
MVMKSDQWKIFKVNFVDNFMIDPCKLVDVSKSQYLYGDMEEPRQAPGSVRFTGVSGELDSETVLSFL